MSPARNHNAGQPHPTATAQQLADRVAGRLSGDSAVRVHGVAEIDRAAPGQLTFIGSLAYARCWPDSAASAALIGPDIDLEPGPARALIHVADVDLAMARIMELFASPEPMPAPGVDPTAVVDSSAVLCEGVRIGPLCVVGPEVHIGPGTVLQSQVTVMQGSSIGADCMLWPGVVVRERCRTGDRCILHMNVTLGSDGFGYRPHPETGELVKIPQIGTVWLGCDVEVGAATCIDRGKFGATTVGDGTKIDNLVQIGHNCRIGRSVVIAGSTGVAGSVTIGDGAMIGGMVAVKDHIKIGAGARLTGGAQVMHDVPDGQTWGGSPAMPFRELAAQVKILRRLPGLVKQWRRG